MIFKYNIFTWKVTVYFDMKYIIVALTIIILLTTTIAIILNIKALKDPDTETKKIRKINSSIFILSLVSLVGFNVLRIYSLFR